MKGEQTQFQTEMRSTLSEIQASIPLNSDKPTWSMSAGKLKGVTDPSSREEEGFTTGYVKGRDHPTLQQPILKPCAPSKEKRRFGVFV